MMLCFYCNKPNADRIVTGQQKQKIRVHAECIGPLRSLVKIPITEVK